MRKIKVMTVFGTRPEGIKNGPVVKALEQDDRFSSVVVSTGQHAEMLQQVFSCFSNNPDYDLKIMHPGQTLTEITIETMTKLEPIIQEEQPDIVLVHGDTSSAYASAFSCLL